MNNKCADMSCQYNHSPQLMREEREKIRKLWDAPRPFNASTRVRPPPNKPPNDLKAVNLIQQQKDRDSEDDQPEENFNVIEGLMRVYQTNQYWKAANKEAKVRAADKDTLILTNVMTLFDTGASSGNFVSEAFVRKHGLQNQLLNRSTKRLRLRMVPVSKFTTKSCYLLSSRQKGEQQMRCLSFG